MQAGRRSSVANNGSSRGLKKPNKKPISGGISANFAGGQRGPANNMVATSLPVNIPDWSRILGEEYREHKRESEDDVDDDDDEDQEDDYGRLPPHEYLARIRGSSFSVHEGVGRTLKGRDLSRVRNAVWKQTGFED
ncbi:OLC1v1034573C1 [Oldenlandia corymbosa var. corymbosa]|nr:OLC1v1034573C1 [Oldenlandia corymbosa var. corymbosa]